MAATMKLCRSVTRRLVMSSGDIGGGQILGAHGTRMFSSRGTPNYNDEYNYKPPEHYNEQYCYKPPPHYNEDYNNPNNAYSSRDRYFNNISEKHIPTKMEYYDFEKLEYRIFRMEHDFEKYYQKLHHALQESINEIRDERNKIVLDINMEKLTNELNTVIHSTMKKLTNDLIQICAKYVVKPKAALDYHDPMIACEENVEESESEVEQSESNVDDNDRTT